MTPSMLRDLAFSSTALLKSLISGAQFPGNIVMDIVVVSDLPP